jgi:hypothetical protein
MVRRDEKCAYDYQGQDNGRGQRIAYLVFVSPRYGSLAAHQYELSCFSSANLLRHLFPGKASSLVYGHKALWRLRTLQGTQRGEQL